VDLTPDVSTLSPARSADKSAPSLERRVGELVAAVAVTIAEGLREKFQRGSLSASTKMTGGDLIAELYRFRQAMVGYWPFDAIAREHGRAVLLEASGSDITPASVDELVNAVMNILQKVVRATVN